jgi:Flp pilus assembly pilin Flp
VIECVRRFIGDEEGFDVMEYALLAGFITAMVMLRHTFGRLIPTW